MARRSELLTPKSIVVEDGRLPIVESHVDALAASIKEIGLLEPIIVIRRKKLDPPIILVAGRHRLAACLKLRMEAVNCIVENEESEAVERWRALAEIDENLIRLNLTPAKRAKLVKRRKAAYEAVHPETKHGKAPQKKGKGSGKGKAPKTKEPKSGSLVAPSFTDDTAKASGRSPSSVKQDAARGNALGDDLDRIEGTSLDRKSTRLNSSHAITSRMPSSA